MNTNVFLGWGTWFLNKIPSVFLRKMTLKIVDQSVCKFITRKAVTFDTICTYPSGIHMECEVLNILFIYTTNNTAVYVFEPYEEV